MLKDEDLREINTLCSQAMIRANRLYRKYPAWLVYLIREHINSTQLLVRELDRMEWSNDGGKQER